jgi:hypothetical protein
VDARLSKTRHFPMISSTVQFYTEFKPRNTGLRLSESIDHGHFDNVQVNTATLRIVLPPNIFQSSRPQLQYIGRVWSKLKPE